MSIDYSVFVPERPISCGALYEMAGRRGWVIRIVLDRDDGKFLVGDTPVPTGVLLPLLGAMEGTDVVTYLATASKWADMQGFFASPDLHGRCDLLVHTREEMDEEDRESLDEEVAGWATLTEYTLCSGSGGRDLAGAVVSALRALPGSRVDLR